MTELAADTAVRHAIRTELGRTLFVEAGAGTGKTTALVDRVVALVAAGHAMAGIAAITFTEAAASQLRERIRAALVRAVAAGAVGQEAVDQVDEAAISTLHGFAQRILAEHPLEAGLPPGFEVLDEIGSALAFEERWTAFLDELFADPGYADVLLRATATDLDLDQVRQVALIGNDHWDRLAAAEIPTPPLRPVDPAPVVGHLRTALASRQACRREDDRLARHLDGLAPLPARLEAATSELAILQVLIRADNLTCGHGKAANFPGCDVKAVRQALADADEARTALLDAVRREVLDHLLAAVRSFTLRAAEDRRAGGRLEFHDLLVRARDLVRDDVGVRAALRRRFSHLLVDEFQDTDPLQVELALLLADNDDGRLFFVGDAKQSIYRFRRADVALYLRVRDEVTEEPRSLTGNHRSVPGILEWVNHVFGHLIGPGADESQPGYEELVATRSSPSAEAPVVLLGEPAAEGEGIAAVRQREAEEIAATITRMVDERWQVRTGDIRLRDIAVLLPTRTSLPQLETALEDAGVPYRVASASLVWATQEVRDLLSVLRVVDDPTDAVSLVAALRSPALACGDDDLLAYRQAGGAWDLRAPAPAALAADHPVVAGIAVLRALHDDRWWSGVSGMVERVLRELRFFELAFAARRPRDRWRRLRWVLDQARAFEADTGAHGGASLRQFVTWADLQADERSRVRDAAVPEVDDDAVVVHTVHGAKGLEFPAVVLTGLNRAPAPVTSLATVHWGQRRPEVRLTHRYRTAGFEELEAVERRFDQHERVRLLYVAATRAEDHLVVSLHRKHGDAASHAAELDKLCEERPELWRRLDPAPLTLRPPPAAPPPVAAPDAAVRRREWESERRRLLDRLATAPVLAATAVAARARRVAGGDDDEAQPGSPGRNGTAVGRAVHAVLEAVDLATGVGLAELARDRAAAEGVGHRACDVERMARSALAAPSVEEAARAGRYWREGFVGLVYETPEGLVVLDYKTDPLTSPEEVEAAVARHRLQAAAYAAALEASLGRPVAAARLVFVSPVPALERAVEDLRAGRDEIGRLAGVPAGGA